MTPGQPVDLEGRLWAISSYFNPLGVERRRRNYRRFREHLALPLVTVELGRGRTFDLDEHDADVLVRISDGDTLWQKERLLNVALENLPSQCTKVVWLDCDVLFENPSWTAQLDAALDEFVLVRPYARPRHPPPDFAPAPMDFRPSNADALPLPRAPAPMLAEIPSCAGAPLPGQPWGRAYAASRSLLEKHGLYDACIVGGGDVAVAFAACGLASQAADVLRLAPTHRAHYLAWATSFHHDVRGDIGTLGGALIHLWHGRRSDRSYGERHAMLAGHDFDPERDVVRSAEGAWAWTNSKPGLEAALRRYFEARREDA